MQNYTLSYSVEILTDLETRVLKRMETQMFFRRGSATEGDFRADRSQAAPAKREAWSDCILILAGAHGYHVSSEAN